uniref:ATP synthase F0 subunit 8 n=1 Tax=Croscherichia paykulli TaxID=268442 RepID=UPI001FA76FAA|nr:ATP synthase F0 subunit 8 [Croscherichia paykulli]UMR54837.1 ATP synthase F0 subunit 8 [Croscherichia paykulli]
MPQMAPLNWLTLMIYFIAIYIILGTLNFYAFTYPRNFKIILQKTPMKTYWKCL